MNVGWIALPRDIANHWLWNSPRRLRMWMQLVFMANWEKSFAVWGTKRVELERGQFSTTMRALARALDCTKQTLLTFLQLLEDDGMITREIPGNKFTIITIVDYDEIYSPRASGKGASASSRKGVCKMKKAAQNASPETSGTPAEKTIGKDVGNEVEKGLENDEKKGAENSDFPQEKNNEKSENGQFARQTLDRKLDRSINNKKINNNSSSSACAREKSLEIFEKLKNDEYFWQDTARGLGLNPDDPVQIQKLKELSGNEYLSEQLSKGKEIESESELRRHLFNWLRRKKEISGQQQQYTTTKKTPRYGTTQTDSRRGVDPPPPERSAVPAGRF